MLSSLSKSRPLWALALRSSRPGVSFIRAKRYEAFDAHLDQDALAEARSWFQTFDMSTLPRGDTTFARSSGAGGQHVNKTETKAVTMYPVKELLPLLPQALHKAVRSSRYYTASSDALTFHAQTSRSRGTNLDNNRKKLEDEISRIYREMIPGETSAESKEKHKQIEKQFHENRVKQKKFQSSKKQSRRGTMD